MRVACNVIQDLLPLYYDKVCSEETCELVENHLTECEACSQILEALKVEVGGINQQAELGKAEVLKGVKQEMVKKNILVSVLSMLSVVVLLLGVGIFIFSHETPIAFEEGLIDAHQADDSAIDIFFEGGDYHRAQAIRQPIMVDGVEKEVIYLMYSETLWTRHFSRSDTTQVTIGTSIIMDFRNNRQIGGFSSGREVVAVYFIEGDIDELLLMGEAFERAREDAVMLWQLGGQ